MNVCAQLEAVEYYLPERELDNGALSAQFPNWQVEKIAPKMGIKKRYARRVWGRLLMGRHGCSLGQI